MVVADSETTPPGRRSLDGNVPGEGSNAAAYSQPLSSIILETSINLVVSAGSTVVLQ